MKLKIKKPDKNKKEKGTAVSEPNFIDAHFNENKEDDKRNKNSEEIKEIIRKNVFTYFNAIFLLIAILLISAGSFRELTFLPLIIANVLIGIFQQLRAKKVLDDLKLLSDTKYTVVRDGTVCQLTADDLALGDIVELAGGLQIPADGQVVTGKICVNESLLTGEADEIDKVVDSSLLSGSFVVSGSCKMKLTAVGDDCYIQQLSQQAKKIEEHQSEMIHDIDLIVKIAGIAIIPIGGGLLYQGLAVNGLSWQEAVESMVGAVLGMIPEGLYLLLTVALALSAMRLAQNQVLLHDMRSVETLARVDVLCVDKTGTMTTSEMDVVEVALPKGVDANARQMYEDLLAQYVYTIGDNNATAKALEKYFKADTILPYVDKTQFSSKYKYSQIETDEGIYRLGASEFVLSGQDLRKNQAFLNQKSHDGLRVLAFVKEVNDQIEPLLFIVLKNQLRENVQEIFQYMTDQKVRVIVISGDNPKSVSQIAKMAGVANSENYVDCTTLMNDNDYQNAVSKYTVFGRVKPEQKAILVNTLQAKGLKVAMVGDGVNDILAMKDADCSIAMGSGSDAARQAAQVVLLDDDFSHMEQIIGEGRKDINNITRSATLFLYKNLFSALLAVFSIAAAFTYPLKPTQISLVSAFNIGVPGFFLAIEPNEEKQEGRFILKTLFKALPASLTSFFVIAVLVVFVNYFGISSDDLGVASTYLLAFVGFGVLLKLCQPLNWFRIAVIVVCAAGFLICAWFLPELFAMGSITKEVLLLAIVFAFAEESLMRYLSRGFDWLSQKIDNWYDKKIQKKMNAFK